MTLLKISFLYAIFFSVVIVTWQGLTFVAIYAQPVQNSTNIRDLLYSTNNGNVTNIIILDTTDPIKTEVSFVEKGIINETIQVTSYQSRDVY